MSYTYKQLPIVKSANTAIIVIWIDRLWPSILFIWLLINALVKFEHIKSIVSFYKRGFYLHILSPTNDKAKGFSDSANDFSFLWKDTLSMNSIHALVCQVTSSPLHLILVLFSLPVLRLQKKSEREAPRWNWPTFDEMIKYLHFKVTGCLHSTLHMICTT